MSDGWKAPDFWSMLARKSLGLPDEWRWTSLEAMDGGGGRRYSKIEGSIPDGVLFKSGPRKGKVNWKHKHDERTLIVPFEEYEAFVAAWEKETGLCSKCGNTGYRLAGWSQAEGQWYTPKCDACGRSPEVTGEVSP